MQNYIVIKDGVIQQSYNLENGNEEDENQDIVIQNDPCEVKEESSSISRGIEQKLTRILYSSDFCGICLQSSELLCPIDTIIDTVTGDLEDSKTIKEMIFTVFNEEMQNVLANSSVCNFCTDKIIQSYIFIENTKKSTKLINNYINDLYSKTVDVYNQLDFTMDFAQSNVVIVLQNDATECIPRELRKEEEVCTEKLKVESLTKTSVRFALPSVRRRMKKRKEARLAAAVKTKKNSQIPNLQPIFHDDKKTPKCLLCEKVFSTPSNLIAHYKLHSRVVCKICRQILSDDEQVGHMTSKHAEALHQCNLCSQFFFSIDALRTHQMSIHSVENSKGNPQCIMCLKIFVKNEIENHKCRYNCPDCKDVPCIHYKYLVSYREQVLNNVSKVKCLDCNYVCRKKEVLLGHVNKEHLNHHPYKCEKCGQQFYYKVMLKSHLREFHQEIFFCEYCDQEFKDENILITHKVSCESISRNFACNKCLANFDTVDELSVHERVKHSLIIFPCSLCNKKFMTDRELELHKARVHSGLQTTKIRRMKLECTICDTKFDTKAEILQHVKMHGPNAKFPCKTCHKHFESYRELVMHCRKHFKPYLERVQCQICGKNLAAGGLPKHMLRHAAESGEIAQYHCDKCGKLFTFEHTLKTHMQTHLSPIPCTKCGKLVKQNTMDRHLKTHDAEKDSDKPKTRTIVKCDSCDYTAKNKFQIENHINRHHLKIKPYICGTCHKDFCGKQQLIKHLETHTTDKECICEICSKKFANPVCLKLHLRIHTGEANYQCDLCGEKFRTSSIRKAHMIKQHSEKSVGCPMCGTMYYTVRNMRQHFKKVHWKYKDRKFDPREVVGLSEEYYHMFEDGRRPRVDETEYEFSDPVRWVILQSGGIK